MYLAYIKEGRNFQAARHQVQGRQDKFSLPQGNGHFASRFSWLDELPPFYSLDRMTKTCRYLKMKHVAGKSSQSPAVTIKMPAPGNDAMKKKRCPCCRCNEDLLKLQVKYIIAVYGRNLVFLIFPYPEVASYCQNECFIIDNY